ncbi:MAG: peptidylprolyl isomerase [Bacteroidetes bacterium]|nr:peptidylprolyl isomerase [Bacteroidota bacterium]
MGVMERLRNSTGAILWLLIISFGLLWVLADTQVFDALSAGPRQLGEVDGESITFELYNARVSFLVTQHNQRYTSEVTPEIRAAYEQQAWSEIVTGLVFQNKMEEVGITVTEQELVNMIVGPNPDAFIRQQFADDNGQIDRAALQAAIDAPENSQVWIAIEQQLKEKRRQQKVTNFLASSNRTTTAEARRQLVLDRSTADVELLRMPYAAISDADAEPTDREVKQWYDANRELFERAESFEFSYVSFPIFATAEDTTRLFDEVALLAEEFATTEDDSTFLNNFQTEIPYRGVWVDEDDLREDFELVKDLAVGEVSEVVSIRGNPYVFKVIDRRGDEVKFGVLTYTVEPDQLTTVIEVLEEAEDFQFFALDTDFDEEAASRGLQVGFSVATPNAAVVPGIGQSIQIPTMLQGMKEGELSDVVELEDQFIVMQLDRKMDEGFLPLEEVRPQVVSRVRLEKKKALAAQRLDEAYRANGFEGLTNDDVIEFIESDNIRFSSVVIGAVGREPALIGAISATEEGATTPVLEGESAAYIARVVSKDIASPESLPIDEIEGYKEVLRQTRGNIFSQILSVELQNEASVKDFRDAVLQ